MAIIDSLVVFVVSLLIGALGIYVGAEVMTDESDYTYAIVTALVGAVVWTLVALFVGWVPLLGPLLALLAYVTVINVRYPGGYGTAIGIAFAAWLAAFVVLYVLGAVGWVSLDAVGVPGL